MRRPVFAPNYVLVPDGMAPEAAVLASIAESGPDSDERHQACWKRYILHVFLILNLASIFLLSDYLSSWASIFPPDPPTEAPTSNAPTRAPEIPRQTLAPTVEANWAQVGQVIRGSKNSSEEKFGWSVSVSSFKAVLAVGAPYERDVGVVHTYKYDEFARMWDHIGVLEGDKVGCEFGNSTALSAEGDFLAIGARNHYDGRGQVRVYKMSNGTWELVGQPLSGKLPDDNFGNAVSLSASGLVLGVSAASVDKTGVGVNSGLVHVFWYDIVNKLWRPRGPDLSGVGAFDRFGFSMVLSGDGDVVAIGAPFHGQKRTLTGGITTIDWGGQVRAYRYHPNADKWIPMGDPILNRTANERSGWAIDLSAKMARSSLSGPR